MAESPLVSIITPCYNGEATLGRLLDSIMAQRNGNSRRSRAGRTMTLTNAFAPYLAPEASGQLHVVARVIISWNEQNSGRMKSGLREGG